MFDCVMGRQPMPWEAPGAAERVKKLRGFKRHIMQCLDRDPWSRPTADAVLMAWRHMFDARTTTVSALSMHAASERQAHRTVL
jgi:hypothetical protein